MSSLARTSRRDMYIMIPFAIFMGIVMWKFLRPDGDPKLESARSELQHGRIADARRQLDQYVAANPDSPAVYEGACGVAMGVGRWNLAEQYARRGVQACKYADSVDRSVLYCDLSSALAQMHPEHPQTQALEAARHAFELNPHDSLILNNLGYLLADNNLDLPRARNYLTEALRLAREKPGDPEAADEVAEILDSYGWLLYRENKPAAAIDILTQAISDLPESDAVGSALKVEYYHLGAAFARANRSDDARRAFTISLSYDPDFEPAKTDLAHLNAAEASRPAEASTTTPKAPSNALVNVTSPDQPDATHAGPAGDSAKKTTNTKNFSFPHQNL